MSDLKPAPTENSLLDAWLLEARAPHPAPDLTVSVMTAIRDEPRHAPRRLVSQPAFPAAAPPPLFSGGALWRPALAMVGALALAILALILWSGTAGGERWLPVLLAAVENPVFKWLAGTLLACAAAIAVPMAWMEA
jgi:negative regulator of sigma E activity